MSLYRPSALRDYLKSLGIHPKKALSQNFLIDGNVIRKVIALADVQPGDTVVEIGPGPGAISEAIVEAGANLIAIETDKVLAKGLKRLPNTTVYCADFLEFPLDEKITSAKVIANLPYHITSPVLGKLALLYDKISTITVIVQDEVGRRMTAQAGEKEYSHFSLFLKFYGDLKYGFQVSNRSFYPPPKVQSAVVQMALSPPPISEVESFFKLTRGAFSQKRKMLRSSLAKEYGAQSVEKALLEIGRSEKSRPGELSLDAFIDLWSALRNP